MLAIDVKALCDIPYDLPSIDQRVFRVLPSSNEVLLELEMKESISYLLLPSTPET